MIMVMLFLLYSQIMSKYFRVGHNLAQEFRVLYDGFVYLVEFLFIPQTFENLLIRLGKSV